jgi:hypothetical protein
MIWEYSFVQYQSSMSKFLDVLARQYSALSARPADWRDNLPGSLTVVPVTTSWLIFRPQLRASAAKGNGARHARHLRTIDNPGRQTFTCDQIVLKALRQYRQTRRLNFLQCLPRLREAERDEKRERLAKISLKIPVKQRKIR